MTPSRRTFHVVGRVAVALLALVLIVGTGVPEFHSNEWWIRLFDFPRIQIAILLGLTLLGYVALRLVGRLWPSEYALAGMVGVALVAQAMTLAPYMAMYPTEMSDSRGGNTDHRVSILLYNVLSHNREVTALRDLIRDIDPDVILLSEPTQWWLDQLDGLERDYPYTLLQPQENQYGKLLYSRLELVGPEIRFLIEPGVPSVRSQVRLRSGTLVTLFGVHPRPPGLKEAGGKETADEREDSDVRDAELLAIAQEVEALGNVPVLVIGDFNDVAWSRTTGLFQRLGGLLDPRVGRGFINSFDATNPLLRYPLDHVFASQHFRLVEMRRLPEIGSDHFPVLVILEYDPDVSDPREEPQPEAGDRRDADKAVEKGKAND